MVVRVAEPGHPAFQLRKGEEGISVFDLGSLNPALTESEILDNFRPGSRAVARQVAEIEAKGLRVVPIPGVEVTADLIEAIRTFPVERDVEHCGTRFGASPFDLYADCPQCGARIKVRSFSGVGEIEDIFDAVFEWMNLPTAEATATRRRAALGDED